MKSRLTSFILFLIMILLIGVIGILGFAIYLNITEINSEDTIYTINSIFSKDKKDNNITNSSQSTQQKDSEIDVQELHIDNKSKERYYYEQLTDIQKKIYDGLYENKENMRNGTYEIQYGGVFSKLLDEAEGKKKLGQDYQSAVETFLYDNPDVFYVDANKLFLSVETSTTVFKQTHNVYIGPAKDSTYYVDGFDTEAQVNLAVKKIENVRDKIISKLTGKTYRDILIIHDFLVDSIDYDSNYNSIGSYSIYGALVDKKCVCEGYAKALKYLLNAADIPCEIAQGTAKNSRTGKTESHAWNLVNINEKWYYIDATWDDPIILGQGTVAKSIQYKYFMKGSKTFDKDHKLSYKFSDNGRTYRYPIAQEYDYE